MAFDNKIKFVIEYTRHYEKGSDRDWNPEPDQQARAALRVFV